MIKPLPLVALLLSGLACATSSSPTSPSPTEPSPAGDSSVPEVKDAELAVDVTKPPYRPQLTPDLNVAGNVVWGVFRVCADPDGKVYEVGVITSAADQVDAQWQEVLRTWRYRPYLVDGKPVPFCNKVRVEVKAQT